MVNQKSLENLRKGRAKGVKKVKVKGGKTWAELIEQVGQEEVPNDSPAFVLGKTWKLAVVRAAFRHAAAGNASILKELMQRSEPQPFAHLDLTKLNAEQLERIANGEDAALVIATSGTGGA